MQRCRQHTDFSGPVSTDQKATTHGTHQASGDTWPTIQDGPTGGGPSILFNEQSVGKGGQQGAGEANRQAQRECPPERTFAQQSAEGTGPVCSCGLGQWIVVGFAQKQRECSNRCHHARLDKCADRPAKVLNEEGQSRPSKGRASIFCAVHDAVGPTTFTVWHHVNRQRVGGHILQRGKHVVGQQPSGELIR